MGKIISFINMKGGVGKTTLCIGIGDFLANYKKNKVLLIDLDPQFNTTQSIMNKYNLEDKYLDDFIKNNKTIQKIFETPAVISEKPSMPKPNDIIVELNNNFHIIPGTINLIFEDTKKSSSTTKRLKKFISDNSLHDKYDFILIDCPPTISIFTDSALIASDYYLVPNLIDRYSILGIKLLSQVIERLKFDEDINIKPLGIVYTMLEDNLTDKTKLIKQTFENSDVVKEVGIFENSTSFVRDLKVGLQGNISSSYSKSKTDIEAVTNELIGRINNE